ncbi:MAG TPA: hypothetical protein VGC30_08565, partial [Dokdonella sp.]
MPTARTGTVTAGTGGAFVERGLAVVAIATAAAFIGVPIWELIVPGPFDWHVQTAAYWQGGLEAVALIAIVSAAFLLRPRWPRALAIVAVALYLRRHAVDAALLVDALYLEIVVGVGMTLRRLLRVPPASDSLDYVLAFVAGLAVWSVCAWTASAFELGSARDLQWLTVLLAAAAAFGGQRPLLAQLWRRARAQTPAGRLWCGALAAWLLVLFARARVAIGFDTQWYGLRGAYVLVPDRSVYEPLALTSPVHYYPKLYELF